MRIFKYKGDKINLAATNYTKEIIEAVSSFNYLGVTVKQRAKVKANKRILKQNQVYVIK